MKNGFTIMRAMIATAVSASLLAVAGMSTPAHAASPAISTAHITSAQVMQDVRSAAQTVTPVSPQQQSAAQALAQRFASLQEGSQMTVTAAQTGGDRALTVQRTHGHLSVVLDEDMKDQLNQRSWCTWSWVTLITGVGAIALAAAALTGGLTIGAIAFTAAECGKLAGLVGSISALTGWIDSKLCS